MTEEEYFIKNFPDSCYYDKPLSPHWDYFQFGVEFGERESEKKIADLEEKLANADYQLEGRDLEIKELQEELTKAKEIIKNLLSAYTSYADSFDDRDNGIISEAEQFLSEVEK